MNSSVKVGDRVRDTVSGFVGIATSRSENMGGRAQVCVTAETVSPTTGLPGSIWLDEGRLEVTGAGAAAAAV